MGSVCRAIATIANKKREEKAEDYEIDYEAEGTDNYTLLNLGN